MFDETAKALCNEYHGNEEMYNRIVKELNDLYAQGILKYRDSAQAKEYALTHVGIKELFVLAHEKEAIEVEYASFKIKYTKYIRYGIMSIIIMPIIFLAVLFTVEAKIIFLLLWIASIISIAVFLIIIEYKNFEYKEKLGEIEHNENNY